MLSTDDRRLILRAVASQTFLLKLGDMALEGRFNDSATAASIAAACPLDIRLSRWGDEYYGDCGVVAGAEPEAREVMEIGEVAYWPPGRALCVFFGPTPASDRYGAAGRVAGEPSGHPPRGDRRPGGGAVVAAGECQRPDDPGIGAES